MSTNNDTTREGGDGVREKWRTGFHIPAVEQRHRDAAAWALDRAPDGLSWDGLTAAHVTPERRWQANRMAEAFARFERALATTSSPDASPDSGEGVLAVVREAYAAQCDDQRLVNTAAEVRRGEWDKSRAMMAMVAAVSRLAPSPEASANRQEAGE